MPVRPSSSFGATRSSKFSQELSRGVVSLVQNHVVECGGIDRGAVPQRIDRRKHVALNGGPLALVQQLAEVAHLERVAKDATRLFEDLAAVRDIEQRLHASRLPQGAVIDRGHNGLPRARRRDYQIAMPSELARGREFLKHRLLEVPRFDLDQQILTRIVARVRRESPPQPRAVRVIPMLVTFELMCIGPVLVERLLHLRDQRRLIRLRHANVPFEPVGLRGVREIRRTHERRREPAGAMKDPRLRMQPRRVLVVRNLHRRIRQRRQSLDRKRIRRPHIRRGQHAQRAAARVAVPLDLRAKLLEAAELDERAQKVDRVGAIELAPQVLKQLVALGIDDQARGMERPTRPLGRLCRPRDDRSEPLGVQPQLVIALERRVARASAAPRAALPPARAP